MPPPPSSIKDTNVYQTSDKEVEWNIKITGQIDKQG